MFSIWRVISCTIYHDHPDIFICSTDNEIYGKADFTRNSLKFSLSGQYNAVEQCFLSYGELSSSHLISIFVEVDANEEDRDSEDGEEVNRHVSDVDGHETAPW